MKPLNDRLAEMVEWGIEQWDAAIDAALVEFGQGAKPSPQQRGAQTKRIDRATDDLARYVKSMPGVEE